MTAVVLRCATQNDSDRVPSIPVSKRWKEGEREREREGVLDYCQIKAVPFSSSLGKPAQSLPATGLKGDEALYDPCLD